MNGPTVCTPLRTECAALRGRVDGARIVHTGRGHRSAAWARGRTSGGAVLVAGVAGALDARLRPGDVVVATEVRTVDEARPCPSAPLLAGSLRRRGLPVHLGPVVSRPRVVTGRARLDLAGTGALAVDTESAALVATAGPAAVVRVVVDTPTRGLLSPGTAVRGLRALHALRAAGPALAEWAAAAGAREVVLLGHADHEWAVRARAAGCDLVLLAGPAHCSVVRTPAGVAERAGCPVWPVGDVAGVDLRRLRGAGRIGLTAAARAPRGLVDDLVHALTGLGPVTLRERRGAEEDLRPHSHPR